MNVATAAPPVLDYLYPVGGQLGQRFEIQFGGADKEWPYEAWADHEGITFENREDKKGWFYCTIATNVPPGNHLIRLMNSNGVSRARWFRVGDVRECLEKEKNNQVMQAQLLTNLPVVVNGGLDERADVDVFALDLASNQTLQVACRAYTLDAGIDSLLYLLDDQGHRLAMAHDAPARALDPILEYKIERDGRYYIQYAGFKDPPSSDVRFYGAPMVRYRLRFSIDPAPFVPRFPTLSAEATEPEKLSLPQRVQGVVSAPRQEDRFAFEVKKGRFYTFTPLAQSVGSPLDPYLSVRNKDGRELGKADDTKSKHLDAPLEWESTIDGPAEIRIRDAMFRGGEAFKYQLAIAEAAPSVRASTETDTLQLEAGKTAKLKINVERRFEDKRDWVVVAHDVPEGVQVVSREVGKAKSVELDLTRTDSAKPGHYQVRFSAVSTDPEAPAAVPVEVQLKGKATIREDLVPNTQGFVWVTVL